MQRSFLGDVSPPTSFSSTETSMMANSLITSIDFANVSYFMNASNGGGDATTHHISNQTMNNYQPTQQSHYQPIANNETFDQMTIENLLNTSPPASIPSDQSYAVQTENILNSTFATVNCNKTLVVHNATSDPIAEEDEDQCLSATVTHKQSGKFVGTDRNLNPKKQYCIRPDDFQDFYFRCYAGVPNSSNTLPEIAVR